MISSTQRWEWSLAIIMYPLLLMQWDPVRPVGAFWCSLDAPSAWMIIPSIFVDSIYSTLVTWDHFWSIWFLIWEINSPIPEEIVLQLWFQYGSDIVSSFKSSISETFSPFSVFSLVTSCFCTWMINISLFDSQCLKYLDETLHDSYTLLKWMHCFLSVQSEFISGICIYLEYQMGRFAFLWQTWELWHYQS